MTWLKWAKNSTMQIFYYFLLCLQWRLEMYFVLNPFHDWFANLISSCSGWEFYQMLMSEQHLFLTIFLVTFGGLLLCWTYILYFLFWAGIAIFYGYGWNSRHRSDRIISFQEESKFCLPPFVLDPHYWVWMWKQVQEKVKSGIFGALHQVSDGEVGKFVVKELCIQWWTWKCGISWKCVKQFCENITFVDNKLDGKFRFGSCCWECTML